MNSKVNYTVSFLIYVLIFISCSTAVVATEENIDDEAVIKKKSRPLATHVWQEKQSNPVSSITSISSYHSFLPPKLLSRMMKYFNNKETKKHQ